MNRYGTRPITTLILGVLGLIILFRATSEGGSFSGPTKIAWPMGAALLGLSAYRLYALRKR